MSKILSDYLSEIEAARELKCTVRTLRTWRSRREGPSFVRLARRIMYRRDALSAWLLEREEHPVRSKRVA